MLIRFLSNPQSIPVLNIYLKITYNFRLYLSDYQKKSRCQNTKNSIHDLEKLKGSKV